MPKKEQGNSRRSKSKRAGKKRASVLHKKQLAGASAAQAEKEAQLSSQTAEATSVKAEEPTPSKLAEQSSSKRVEQSPSKRADSTPSKGAEQSPSKRASHSDEVYRTLHEACAKSKHLAGQLSQHRSGLLLHLPASLPSSLIFRALNKEMNRYKELRINRIAAREDQLAQLELLVEGMREDQLTTFIQELDELIGDFTGRS